MTMRITRSETERLRTQFKRVMFEELGLYEEHPLMKAFDKEGVNLIINLTNLKDYIDGLDYIMTVPTQDGGMEMKTFELTKGDRGYLKMILEYMRYKGISTYDDVKEFDGREFDVFRTTISSPSIEHHN